MSISGIARKVRTPTPPNVKFILSSYFLINIPKTIIVEDRGSFDIDCAGPPGRLLNVYDEGPFFRPNPETSETLLRLAPTILCKIGGPPILPPWSHTRAFRKDCQCRNWGFVDSINQNESHNLEPTRESSSHKHGILRLGSAKLPTVMAFAY